MRSVFTRLVDPRNNQERIQIAQQEIAKVRRLAEMQEERRDARGLVPEETDESDSRGYGQLQKELYELRSRWNSIVPIARLPLEILAAVFGEYVADHWGQYDQTLRDFPRPYSWFVILHVCRGWRRAAFFTPGLWTCIVPTSPPCVSFIISHSGCVPLTIRFGQSRTRFAYSDTPSPNTFESAVLASKDIFTVLPRVKAAELRLWNETRTYLLDVEKQSSGLCMPLLQHLTLVMDDENDIGPLSRAGMSRLTSLTICGATPELLNSSIRTTLTSLEVELGDNGYPADVIISLQQLPLLCRLMVSSTISPAFLDDPVSEIYEPMKLQARLPALKYLGIKAHARNIAQFFNSIHFPHDTDVELEFAYDDIYDVAHDAIVGSIASKTLRLDSATTGTPHPGPYPRRLEVKETAEWELTLRLWTSDRPEQVVGDGFGVPSDQPRLSLVLPIEGDFPYATVRVFAALLPELPAMSLYPKTHINMYKHTFGRVLPNLESLRFSDDHRLVVALTATLPQKSHSLGNDARNARRSSPPACHLFPKLKVLEIEDAVFHPGPHQDEMTPFFLKLIACLRTRALHGCKVQELKLARAVNLSPDDVTVLEEYAGSVELLDDVIMAERLMNDEDDESCCDWDSSDSDESNQEW
ncbi:hypothetical protein NM688_g2418 [Phlebia brevispora]|uniref:Uncharacterized protein n=1 Tax=Phlebia brevispora TaxID=194682 RepID=A0ACC1T8T2_9APHY|nr:hypothetical protein NM688_g2418 [Phlebia brevispora]